MARPRPIWTASPTLPVPTVCRLSRPIGHDDPSSCAGTAAQANKAFGVTLHWHQSRAENTGALTTPFSFPRRSPEVVEAVIGLDNRPVRRRGPVPHDAARHGPKRPKRPEATRQRIIRPILPTPRRSRRSRSLNFTIFPLGRVGADRGHLRNGRGGSGNRPAAEPGYTASDFAATQRLRGRG